MTIVATAFYETDWFKAILYIVIAIVVARVVDFLLARRDRALARLLGKTPDSADRTRFLMIRRLLVIVILFVGFALALLEFPMVGTIAKAMLASAAIIAGVIGIAARAPIANLASGIMIAFAQPVRLNDYISVGGEFGTVERITLIYTYIRSADGRRIVIPNEAFASTPVHNYSMGAGSVLTVDVRLPVDADVDAARTTMRETGEQVAPAPEGKSVTVEVAEIGGDGVLLRLHAWADDPVRRRDLASDLRAAVLKRLRDEGLAASGADVEDGRAGSGAAGEDGPVEPRADGDG